MKPAEITDVDPSKLGEITERLKQRKLEESDYGLLIGFLGTLQSIVQLFQQGRQTIHRLKAMLFGASTERTRNLTGKNKYATAGESGPSDKPKVKLGKRKGHGRLGANQYSGAKTVSVDHSDLAPGSKCPKGCGSRVYDMQKPSVSICFVAQPMIDATQYKLQTLRCSGCGCTYTADLPEKARKKYDENVGPALGVARYGFGMAMNRMVELQKMFNIPLPLGTQYGQIDACYQDIGELIMKELTRQAAMGGVVHNDDTPGRILDLKQDIKERQAALPPGEKIRTGIFTTGIVSTHEGRTIVLYATGNKHAGENLLDILVHRPADMPAPIQMCDALSRNYSGLATELTNCNSHARREFVLIIDQYPAECAFVLESYRRVYINEAYTKSANMPPGERLLYHQLHSLEPMNTMKAWMDRQMIDKLVEPNSTLGGAIQYASKRWDKLTLFLRKAGVPIDNNICERILKTAIRHRKNSLFYKTQNGANVGDFFMSVIQTCRFCNINPIHYLATLRRKIAKVTQNPANWMPWNFQANDTAPA